METWKKRLCCNNLHKQSQLRELVLNEDERALESSVDVESMPPVGEKDATSVEESSLKKDAIAL